MFRLFTNLKRIALPALFVSGLLILASTEAEASHFRYATVDYKPILDNAGNPTGTVEFHIRSGWRRSFFGAPVLGDVIVPETFLFGDGASVSVSLTVTSFSATEDWVLGEFTVQHHYATAGPFTAMGNSSARLSNLLNGGNQGWRYDTLVSPYSTNNSPSTSLPPVVSLVTNSLNQFFVPVSDLERDSLRFSIAPRADTGVTAANYPPAGLTIDATSGLLSWDTTGAATGLWFVQIWIADLDSSGNVKSRVPVDFLLNNNLTGGGSPPACLVNGLASSASFSVSPGKPLSFTVTGTSPNINPVTGNADTPVTLNVSGLPVGATMTPSFTLTAASPVTSTFDWTPTAANGGSFTVSYTATDSFGRAALNSVNIFVETNHPPVASCKSVTVPADTDSCSAQASIDDGSYDPDAGDSITLKQSPAGPYPLGDTLVTLEVTDNHGASSSCTATVTVADRTPPAVPVLADVTGECSATATVPTTTDNCAGTVTGTTDDALSYNTQGTHVITWTFNDGHGNSSTAKQNVIVKDVTPPAVPVLADVTGECSATATVPTTTDNCAGTLTGTTDDALTYNTQGTHVITWTFNDGHGNSSTAKQNVIVKDVTPPAVPVLADVTGECSATATVPTTTDNCAGTVTGTTDDALTYNTQGTHVITWTFNDGHGNSSTAKQNVIVKDVTPPAVPVLADVTGECSAIATIPTTTDNCAGTVTGTTDDALTYNTQGTHVITWTFNDGRGNSSTAKQNVIVKDVTPPTITNCPNVTVQTGPNRTTCDQVATWTAPQASDNCTVASLTSDHNSGDTFPKGVTLVTYTAKDAANPPNITTRSFTVTVVDNTPPTITCPSNISVVDNAPDACGAFVDPGTPHALDNCGVKSVAGVRSDGKALSELYPVGTTTITWTATDTSGNTTPCQQTVKVTNPAPTVTITGPGTPQPVNTRVNFTATFADNAGDTHKAVWTFDGKTQTGTVNEALHTVTTGYTFSTLGPHAVALTVTDDCGQQASASISTLVYTYETVSGGSFVIGDRNAAIGTAVTFWGANWNVNSLSGGTAPAGFKGFADRTSSTSPSCGGTWTTDGGIIANPPLTVPAYLGVFVTSSITQSGSIYSGNIRQIVVVKTNPGYYAKPGPRITQAKIETGTGTVVAVVCP